MPIVLRHLIKDAVFLQLDPVGPKSRGVQHVTSGFDVVVVQIRNGIRVFQHPLLCADAAPVAPFLKLGPRGAVQQNRKMKFHNMLLYICLFVPIKSFLNIIGRGFGGVKKISKMV